MDAVLENADTLLVLARSGVHDAERLLAEDSLQLAELNLDAGRLTEATNILGRLPSGERDKARYRILLARTIMETDPAEAERLLRIARFQGARRANLYLGMLYEARGQLEEAEVFYETGFQGHTIDQNVEVTLYQRRGTSDLLPQLVQTGLSEHDAAPWLALARLYVDEGLAASAQEIYDALARQDPYFQLPTP
jgi:thioredoxin-like negative regulator of GroEL